MNNFSIVIPVFNEDKNIRNLIYEITNSLNQEKYNYEIILVNDASTDKTFLEIQSLINIFKKKIIQINNNENSGQSFSISEGVIKSSFETIVTMDGDGQNNPKDIPKLLSYYFAHQDVFLVGGIRKNRKDSVVKKISSRIANNVRKIIFNDKCNDTGCSLKVFDKGVFIKFPFFDGIHRFLPALFSGYGKKTFFIHVDHRPRIYGYSKYGTYGRLIKGIRDLFKVAKIIKKFKSNRA